MKKFQKTAVLTFDDCCKCHIEKAVPVLKKYGFTATFFFCRFNDEWRSKHGRTLMTPEDAARLCEMGFEVGNHTWNHPDMRKLTDYEASSEFDSMEQWLRDAGCPPSVSFAYPGGPYAANIVPLLKKKGIKAARSTEPGGWFRDCDPMNVPSYAIVKDNEVQFLQALEPTLNGASAVFVYHGIPEIVHPHCSNSLEFFEENMKYLSDHGYRGISMREQLEEYGF